ncbi:hypothetical protein DRF59_11295 [Chryseobacterium flavum]|uniref:DUF695 domain-containing protein n=1 Tax=Chryseobacterium flavum TaxID=415851 RepID=A0A3D9CMC9_9FLAO|nr:hypothetical protein [Chryseobacterium flavum]REC66882.1 hypothetical protein DRF59_11295 [Chryseobacterium flavum]
MKEKEFNNFWNWIENNIEYLTPKKITAEYIDLLDAEIEKIGDFSWEIGFDNRVNKNFLTISPEGDAELLKLSRTIINEAPAIEGWIFYSSKPPKQWKLIFNLLINDEKVQFNATEWKYILYKYPDNVYDVVIQVPKSYMPYDEYFHEIGDIAVTGELGEAFVIEYINEIDVVYEFDKEDIGKEKDFIHLKTEILM